LESRTVPSGFGGFLGALGNVLGGFGGPSHGSGSSVTGQDAQKVAQAFSTFEQSYFSAVRTDLLIPSTPNTSQFTTDVGAAFTTLNSSLTSDIAGLTAGNPNLAATVSGDSSSLQTELTALENELPTTLTSRSIRAFENQSEFDIQKASSQAVQAVRTATPPAGTITGQTLNQAIGQVNTAFRTFNLAYANAIQSDLLAPGTTNPDLNATKFDSDVNAALTTLTGSLTTSATAPLSTLESTISTLSTTITNDLASLPTNLAKIKIPTTTNTFALRLFKFESALTVTAAQSQVTRDISSAVSTYNSSLGG
jgi:hypothetical protein